MPKRIAIAGGGAIGTSVARFLAEAGAEVVLVEREGIACAASGKSGGFLARDWCDGTALMPLARRSFDLHASLSERSGGGWLHRPMTTYQGGPGRRGKLPWLAAGIGVAGVLGGPETTAQVHPARFCEGMMRAAEAAGATLRRGVVTGLAWQGGRVAGLMLGEETVAADAVVLALGPWSLLAARWLAVPPVFGVKGHSLVLGTGTAIPPEALFLEVAEADGTALTPEVFPRADGTTYVCAISSEGALPADPARVAPDPGAIARLEALCRRLSPALAAAPVLARQACIRPVTQDGLPLIGPVAGAPGAYVATGHGVWGILNAPATGEAMAELLLEGEARTVDLSPFDPGRLPPLDPARLETHRG